MRSFTLLRVLSLACTAASAPIPAQKEDKDRIQGDWEVIECEQTGMNVAGFVKGIGPRMIFKEDKYRFVNKDDKDIESGEWKLDPKAKIPAIDYTITEGPQKGKTQVGIYELSGDTLKICLNTEGETTRPTGFKTKVGGPEYVTFVMKRKKTE